MGRVVNSLRGLPISPATALAVLTLWVVLAQLELSSSCLRPSPHTEFRFPYANGGIINPFPGDIYWLLSFPLGVGLTTFSQGLEKAI